MQRYKACLGKRAFCPMGPSVAPQEGQYLYNNSSFFFLCFGLFSPSRLPVIDTYSEYVCEFDIRLLMSNPVSPLSAKKIWAKCYKNQIQIHTHPMLSRPPRSLDKL